VGSVDGPVPGGVQPGRACLGLLRLGLRERSLEVASIVEDAKNLEQIANATIYNHVPRPSNDSARSGRLLSAEYQVINQNVLA
jgi:hypothetical protein